MFQFEFFGGLATSKSPEAIEANELVSGVGIWLPPGSANRVEKILGRSDFGSVSGLLPIDGLALCLFDTGAGDKLIAYAGSGLYSAVPGESGTFTLLASGNISPSGTLHSTHWNDRWYLTLGVSENKCVESDGSIRRMGMFPPQTLTSGSIQVGASGIVPRFPTMRNISWPGFGAQTWIDPDFAYDRDDDTYAQTSAQVAGVHRFEMHEWTVEDQTSGLFVEVEWEFFRAASQAGTQYTGTPAQGLPSIRIRRRWGADRYTVVVVSGISGVIDHDAVILEKVYAGDTPLTITQIPLGTSGTSGLYVSCELYLPANTNGPIYTARLREVRALNAGTKSPMTTLSGVMYGITEACPAKGLESPISYSPQTYSMDATQGNNSIQLTLPSGRVNEFATDYYVYRTHDGGVAKRDFGRIGIIQLNDTANPVFIDTFKTPFDTVATPKYALLQIQPGDGVIVYHDRDQAPSAFNFITSYQGSLVGIDSTNPRQLWYSFPGFPESWPIPYTIYSFPLAEHDRLVGLLPIGDSLLILAVEAVMELRGLPLVFNNILNDSSIRKIEGQPGCVGSKAFCTYSTNGEPRGAWVSRTGLHVSNGPLAWRVSDSIDWGAMVNVATLDSAVLYWDERRQMLIMHFDFDGDGINDRYLFFIVKTGVQMPLIFGANYCDCSDIAHGYISGVQRIYSANPDGHIYLEWTGTTDASNAYNTSGVVPLFVETGKLYTDDYTEMGTFKVNTMHSHWGVDESLSLIWTVGRDQDDYQASITNTVSLSGVRGTESFIGLAGEWAQLRLEHLGSGIGFLTTVKSIIKKTSQAGKR